MSRPTAGEVEEAADGASGSCRDLKRLLSVVLNDAARLDDPVTNASIEALRLFVTREINDWIDAAEALRRAGR